MIAADYPFLDVLWTMVIFFLWIIWFMLLFKVIGDIFRRHDLNGVGKTLWILFVILLPFLGIFIYLITQGEKMGHRDVKQMQAAQGEFDEYVKSVAGSGGAAAEIEKAKGLLDAGTITQQEYEAIKAKVLS
jgi:Short C-terminal domain/Phospholipase_D-nuclease N-terminal